MTESNLNCNGAKGNVLIHYKGTLEELGAFLKNKLSLKDLDFETDMDPPHEIFAMGEALGFEYWLYNSNDQMGYNFRFSICTSNSEQEIFNTRMHDISQWLAKYLKEVCSLDVIVVNLGS